MCRDLATLNNARVPAVMVEAGNLRNPEKAARLRDPVVQAERQLLQCVLQFPSAIDPLELALIQPLDFTAPVHQEVFAAVAAVGETAGQSMSAWQAAVAAAGPAALHPHLVDLAVAHVKAVEKLEEGPGIRVWNLGTGRGCSVLEVVRAFEKASGRTIPYRVVPRRLGDIAQTWADPSKAERELGWKALRGLDEMCVDSWRWQERNPNGFGDAE